MDRVGVAGGPIESNTRPEMPACIPRTRVVSTDDASPARSPTARISLRCMWPLTSSGERVSKWPGNSPCCPNPLVEPGLSCRFVHSVYKRLLYVTDIQLTRHHRDAGATIDRSADGRHLFV